MNRHTRKRLGSAVRAVADLGKVEDAVDLLQRRGLLSEAQAEQMIASRHAEEKSALLEISRIAENALARLAEASYVAAEGSGAYPVLR